MSGAKNCPETPRQRMIGMMYLVLTAMLALNVSSDILKGFTLVDSSLRSTIESAELRTKGLYDDFDYLYSQNKDKTQEWLDKAIIVKQKSDSLFSYIQSFKYNIVKLADGKKADPEAKEIIAKDNLDVAGEYALIRGKGKELKNRIVEYRSFLMDNISANDTTKKQVYEAVFSTKDKGIVGMSWEESLFQMMPVSAVITILTKYQSDVRAAEADLVQYLKAQTDASDFRVNKIEALVVPNSRHVIKGGKYSAKVVLSAVDSTKVPEYFIGGRPVSNGNYDVPCNTTGSFTYKGYISLPGNDGISRNYPFESDYIVGEPTATVSNEALNVVYRGIDNVFSISVPGVSSENVNVRVEGGTVEKTAQGRYIIKPTRDGEITIITSAKIDGKDLQMGSSVYRVKYLPDPKSYLQYTDAGGIVRQIQEGSLSKRLLKGNVSIVASYGEDELVKANFNVVSFTMVTPFGAKDTSGSKFTASQLSDIDKLESKDLLTIRNIRAVGPDGKQRSLPPVQVQM
jgi:gliding motility-associated protein GldM